MNVFARRHARRWTAAAMISPAALLLIAFIVLPFVLALALSATNERLLPRPTPTRFVDVANYLRVLGDGDFWQAFWNTFRFAAVVVPLQSAFALGLALLVNGALPGRNLFRGVYFLPTVITMVVVAVVWSSLFGAPQGLLNAIVAAVSFGALGPYDWLHDPDLAMPMIMLMSMWQGAGFQMIIYLAGLQGIDRALYEAARMDGANRWRQFQHVTMPGLRNTHIFVLVTTTILAFKLFSQVEVLTKGGPRGVTDTLVRYIYITGFREQKVGVASAGAVIFFLLVLAIALAQRRLMREERAL